MSVALEPEAREKPHKQAVSPHRVHLRGGVCGAEELAGSLSTGWMGIKGERTHPGP